LEKSKFTSFLSAKPIAPSLSLSDIWPNKWQWNLANWSIWAPVQLPHLIGFVLHLLADVHPSHLNATRTKDSGLDLVKLLVGLNHGKYDTDIYCDILWACASWRFFFSSLSACSLQGFLVLFGALFDALTFKSAGLKIKQRARTLHN
jgi:hypothetical protein